MPPMSGLELDWDEGRVPTPPVSTPRLDWDHDEGDGWPRQQELTESSNSMREGAALNEMVGGPTVTPQDSSTVETDVRKPRRIFNTRSQTRGFNKLNEQGSQLDEEGKRTVDAALGANVSMNASKWTFVRCCAGFAAALAIPILVMAVASQGRDGLASIDEEPQLHSASPPSRPPPMPPPPPPPAVPTPPKPPPPKPPPTPPSVSPSPLPSVPPSPPLWMAHTSTNCYSGMGATHLDGGAAHTASARDCMAACARLDTCDGVVYSEEYTSGQCFFRSEIDVERCDSNGGGWTLYKIRRSPPPPMLPSPPSPPPAPPSSPDTFMRALNRSVVTQLLTTCVKGECHFEMSKLTSGRSSSVSPKYWRVVRCTVLVHGLRATAVIM